MCVCVCVCVCAGLDVISFPCVMYVCGRGFTGADGSVCTACEAGQYKDVYGASGCLACEAGKFSTINASAKCMNCPINTTSPAGSVSLTDCA
jgi:hypothetical protein